MKIKLLILLAALILNTVITTSAQQKTTSNPLVIKEYEGVVNATVTLVDGNFQKAGNECFVVTKQNDYLNFIQRIPTRQISMTNPAPKSNDPLLKKPAVKFDKNSILVCIRNDGMYGEIKLVSIDTSGEKAIVTVSFPPIPPDYEMMAQPIDVGKYKAIVIKKMNKPVEFKILTD